MRGQVEGTLKVDQSAPTKHSHVDQHLEQKRMPGPAGLQHICIDVCMLRTDWEVLVGCEGQMMDWMVVRR